VEFQLKFIVAKIATPGSKGSTMVSGLPDGNGVQPQIWMPNNHIAKWVVDESLDEGGKWVHIDFGDGKGVLSEGDMLGFAVATPIGKKQTTWTVTDRSAANFGEVIDLKNPRQLFKADREAGIKRVMRTKDSIAMVDEFSAGRETVARFTILA